MSTVCESTARISFTDDKSSFISEPSALARLREKTTSSESKSAPSWNFTPLRRLKRHTFGLSLSAFQLVARDGIIAPDMSRCSSASYI